MAAPVIDRGCQSPLYGPSIFSDASPKCSRGHFNLSRPLKKCLSAPKICEAHIGPPIQRLNAHSDPSAVLRGIRRVIVSAIQGEARQRQRLVVGDEAHNIVPQIANRDASAAVIRIRGVSIGIAATHHRSPRREKTMLAQAMCFFTGRSHIANKAPTGLSLAPPKPCPNGNNFVAAIAAAKPCGTFLRRLSGAAHHYQPSKSLATMVNSFTPNVHLKSSCVDYAQHRY